jgi:ribulose-5-phosphate 4-epimerase/fuculose-1-phosphate aldolase
MASEALTAAIHDVVVANRILAREGVVDGFGHVSVRHPERPDRYLLSCSRSPELVTEADIMEFDLDSNPVDARGRTGYAERPIHGGVYKARPDVMSVCHNHAQSLIPFGVTNTPMKPILHMGAVIGVHVPVWDIRDQFGDTDLLVVTNQQGDSLAKTLGGGRVALMRGHGATVASGSLRGTVFTAIYLMANAAMLHQARQMGEVNYLTPGEIACVEKTLFSPLSQNRAWEYWARRAGFQTDVNK